MVYHLNERLPVSALIYWSEVVVVRKHERFKIMAIEMDNHKRLLVIRIDIYQIHC